MLVWVVVVMLVWVVVVMGVWVVVVVVVWVVTVRVVGVVVVVAVAAVGVMVAVQAVMVWIVWWGSGRRWDVRTIAVGMDCMSSRLSRTPQGRAIHAHL